MKPKYFLTLPLILFSLVCFAQKPLMLDNIHYSVADSSAQQNAVNFFKTFFKAKEISEQTDNPLTFMKMLVLYPDETTINISSITEEAMLENDKPVKNSSASKTILPIYGVHWLAINTKSIRKTVKLLLKQGYDFAFEDFTLPNEPDVNAVAMYGFDKNIIVLVERPQLKNKSAFSIDHIQILVKNLETNVKFYQEVLGAVVLDKKDRSTQLKIGNQKLVLSEPEALGLVREQVLDRDPQKFVAHVDYLGFLYDEVEPAFYAAKANNYTITLEPQSLIFNDKATPYTTCRVLSPDNLQIELMQEEGRVVGRAFYKTK